jgi:hypothetical protein
MFVTDVVTYSSLPGDLPRVIASLDRGRPDVVISADPRALSSPQASSVPRLLPGVMPPLVVATTSWAHLVVYAAHEVPLNEGED